MAILSLQDLSTYAPDIDVDVSGIFKAQMIAEGPQGAHRPLEKTPFTETPRLMNGIARLTRFPIDTTIALVVQTRGITRFSVNDTWQTIPDTGYTLDAELGELRIEQLFGTSESRFSLRGGGAYNNYPRQRGRGISFRSVGPEVRVTYTAGFDFQATPESHEVQQIKAALAAIVTLQTSNLSTGLKQETITDFKSETYGADVAQLTATSSGSTLMQDNLAVFRQYRPREYGV